jgi:hypothetical protein
MAARSMSPGARLVHRLVRLPVRDGRPGSPRRYIPSCSNYALDVQQHGTFRGGWLTLRRLLRCHPGAATGGTPCLNGRPLMFDLIATVLAFFYGLVHSYGLAIVLLTITVMAVTSPLTYKGTKSMIQMQRLQPQMKAIQTKYRDDREKMNQEMLAFYKANNVNPVGGCLPMLIQIPVFLVLYRVVRGSPSGD